ncbi:glycosyltransferase family 25 protein [Labrys monachus]|uniref:Glycosyl transferase family 25 n=1 Tax=Labrys monachus TaxID=217067 RepID=A0ABU0FI10_9HYPH|nr:glycosyltransferase family 25 protein [Labrys monachus]MDQ0394249.1 glycosyl transferase family 25 [Labrys monachus]
MRVVVINLKKETRRFERISTLAEGCGFRIERVEAVDGRDPENRELISRHRRRYSLRPPVSDTDIACALSHRKAWKLLLDSDDRWLAVFEDDVHFGNDVAALFDESWIPPQIDLIKLETLMQRGSLGLVPITSVGDRHLHRLGGSNLGTGGYLISRLAAEFLMKMTESMDLPVDSVMFDRRGAVMRRLAVHQIVPAACIQECILAGVQGRADALPSAMIRPAVPARPAWQRFAARVVRGVSNFWSFVVRKGPPEEPMGKEGVIPFA